MAPRIGIISNPRSSSHRAGQAGLAEAAARLPHAAPESREALRAALAGSRRMVWRCWRCMAATARCARC
ncbi:hypothetical protein ACFQU7_25870 [Pseudoroseomonas wenyumeiae]